MQHRRHHLPLEFAPPNGFMSAMSTLIPDGTAP
jgi:hypothetical protein